MTDWNAVPGPGQVWVCGGCGRVGRGKRSDMGDDSCVMWAVLCTEESVVMGANGTATAAKAVES